MGCRGIIFPSALQMKQLGAGYFSSNECSQKSDDVDFNSKDVLHKGCLF